MSHCHDVARDIPARLYRISQPSHIDARAFFTLSPYPPLLYNGGMSASPHRASRFCRACLYPLDGLDRQRCPECGTIFDPADEGTFFDEVKKRQHTSAFIMALAFVPLLIACIGGLLLIWYMLAEFARL